jgi:hypothetical protein
MAGMGHHAKFAELMPRVCFAVGKRAFERGTKAVRFWDH